MSKRIKKDNIQICYYYNKPEITKGFTGIVIYPLHISYLRNGRFHRENNLPSVVFFNNDKLYHNNGLDHRTDGPSNYSKEYHIHGKRVTKEQHEFYSDLLKLKGMS